MADKKTTFMATWDGGFKVIEANKIGKVYKDDDVPEDADVTEIDTNLVYVCPNDGTLLAKHAMRFCYVCGTATPDIEVPE